MVCCAELICFCDDYIVMYCVSLQGLYVYPCSHATVLCIIVVEQKDSSSVFSERAALVLLLFTLR